MSLLVVADTSPLRYLILIDSIHLIPQLFETVVLPTAVRNELRHPSAPKAVQEWAEMLPDWVKETSAPPIQDEAILALDEGERAALTLGLRLGTNLILIDEREGAAVALQKGFEVLGTLGILVRASQAGLTDLRMSVERLRRTNFRCSQALLNTVLDKYAPGPPLDR